MSRVILCRHIEPVLEDRIVGGFYDPLPEKYCCKPIEEPNALEWCKDHRKALPYWEK